MVVEIGGKVPQPHPIARAGFAHRHGHHGRECHTRPVLAPQSLLRGAHAGEIEPDLGLGGIRACRARALPQLGLERVEPTPIACKSLHLHERREHLRVAVSRVESFLEHADRLFALPQLRERHAEELQRRAIAGGELPLVLEDLRGARPVSRGDARAAELLQHRGEARAAHRHHRELLLRLERIAGMGERVARERAHLHGLGRHRDGARGRGPGMLDAPEGCEGVSDRRDLARLDRGRRERLVAQSARDLMIAEALMRARQARHQARVCGKAVEQRRVDRQRRGRIAARGEHVGELEARLREIGRESHQLLQRVPRSVERAALLERQRQVEERFRIIGCEAQRFAQLDFAVLGASHLDQHGAERVARQGIVWGEADRILQPCHGLLGFVIGMQRRSEEVEPLGIVRVGASAFTGVHQRIAGPARRQKLGNARRIQDASCGWR